MVSRLLAIWIVTSLLNISPHKNCASFSCSFFSFSMLKVTKFVCSCSLESTSATNESILKVALDHGKASGVVKLHDHVVVRQKVGNASVVKIIELED